MSTKKIYAKIKKILTRNVTDSTVITRTKVTPRSRHQLSENSALLYRTHATHHQSTIANIVPVPFQVIRCWLISPSWNLRQKPVEAIK